MAYRLPGDEGKVPGGGVVVGVGQTVGVGEVGVGAAQLQSPLVHHLHKGGDAAADVLGDDVAHLVGRGHHGRIQQILQGHYLTQTHPDGGSALDLVEVEVRHGRHRVVEPHGARLNGLHGQQHGHDLGQAGGVYQILLVFGVEGGGRVAVNGHEHRAVGVHGGVIQCRRRGGEHRQHQSEEQDQG